MAHPLALSSFELHKLMRSGAVSLQIRHYQTDEDRRVQRLEADRRRRGLFHDAGLTAEGKPRQRASLVGFTPEQKIERRRKQRADFNKRRWRRYFEAGLTLKGTVRKRSYQKLDGFTEAQKQARRRAQRRNANRRMRGQPEDPVEAERTFEERFLA